MSTGLEQQLRFFFFLLTMSLIVQIKEVCPLIRWGLYIHIYKLIGLNILHLHNLFHYKMLYL